MWKKILISLMSTILLGFMWLVNAAGLQVYIPKEASADPDYQIPDWHSTIVPWQTTITDIISLVNSYLWFAIGFVCFLFMIWNGYQLIIARGNEKQMKTATSSLIGCSIWLVSCLLAYIIVNIAIKFFQ